MRRLILAAFIAAFLVLVRVPVQAQSLVFELFGEYIESLRAQAGVPALAVTIVGPENVLWERAYGRHDLARSLATRTDTPFHLDGLTQVFTASMVLRCVEERRLSLDDRVSRFNSDSPEPDATIHQLLTHTSGAPGNPVFAYRPERLQPLWAAVRRCTDDSFRETLANQLHRLAMTDSVPGADIIHIVPPAEGIPDPSDVEQYTAVLERLAKPYAVDQRGRASVSQYDALTLTPSSGLISTVRDFAKFDLALKQGVLIRKQTLDEVWRAPAGPGEQRLPHGLGWFVQTYNGETVAWQFGVGDSASSSLVITLPRRGLTLIMMATSDRLVKPLPLAAGDLTVSPFARLFLSLFAR
jgi:CubicO group peptidase (beta-lactamase class C family)